MKVIDDYLANYKNMRGKDWYYLIYCGYVWKKMRNEFGFYHKDGYTIDNITARLRALYRAYIEAYLSMRDIIVVCDEKDRSKCIRTIYADVLRCFDKQIELDKEYSDVLLDFGVSSFVDTVDEYVIMYRRFDNAIVVSNNETLELILWYNDECRRKDERWIVAYLRKNDKLEDLLSVLLAYSMSRFEEVKR